MQSGLNDKIKKNNQGQECKNINTNNGRQTGNPHKRYPTLGPVICHQSITPLQKLYQCYLITE